MILVVGRGGQLGTAFAKELGSSATYVGLSSLDLRKTDEIKPFLDAYEPSLLVNAAAYTKVDAAETESHDARLVNAVAVRHMAEWAASRSLPFATFSTDYVFDGSAESPYVESDLTAPLSVYGRTKREGEEMALDAWEDSLVVRTSWLHSGGHPNFLATMLRKAREGGELRVVDDQVGVPNVATDVAAASLQVLGAGARGIAHISSTGEATWYELARYGIELGGLDPSVVVPVPTSEYPTPATRPRYGVLGTELAHGVELPPWRESLVGVVEDLLAWV